MRLNLNETVKVKLTERGKEIYRQTFSPLPDGFEQPEPRIDEDGFTRIQLWMFMRMFGEHMNAWQPNVIEPLEIVFDNEDEIVRCKDCNNNDAPVCEDAISRKWVLNEIITKVEDDNSLTDEQRGSLSVAKYIIRHASPVEPKLPKVECGYCPTKRDGVLTIVSKGGDEDV